MKKTKIQHIIVINFILIGFILFSNKGITLDSNRIILKNMTESTQVNDLNKSIETLNNSHTEYANYIEESKTKIASAITDMGVETSNDATLETMASNIRSIKGNIEFYGTIPQVNNSNGFSFDIPSGIKTVYLIRSQLTYTSWYAPKFTFNDVQINTTQSETTSYCEHYTSSYLAFGSWIHVFELPNNDGGIFAISFDTNPPYHYAYIGY